MYKHYAELIFSGPLMGSPTCSTTDVLLSWACLAEQQLCVEELTLGSIIPRGVFLPGVEGVLRRAWYRPMIQSQKQQQQMYTVSPLTQETRTWLPRDIVSYASSMRIKKPFFDLLSALVLPQTNQTVIYHVVLKDYISVRTKDLFCFTQCMAPSNITQIDTASCLDFYMQMQRRQPTMKRGLFRVCRLAFGGVPASLVA